MPNVSARLPQFPWDRLKPYAAKADAHPGGRVDLSVGTPVDPTPESVRRALSAAADSPGYPTTHGTARLREAASGWLQRELGAAVDPVSVLPLIGSKELVAGLPALLGLGPGDAVAYPSPAYPTYEIGALLCGATPVPVSDDDLLNRWLVPGDAPTGFGAEGVVTERAGEAPQNLRLLWLNSPGNPHGRVHSADALRKIIDWARGRGVIVVSDECYISLGWEGTDPVSVLHPAVCGGSHEGLLAVHSLSKRSNLAGYRSAFLAGDPALVAELLEVRKHAGMMMPGPVQAATAAALDDDEYAAAQKERYRSRRSVLRNALAAAGFRIDHSEAGLYLWASRIVGGEPEACWDTVAHLADLGILAAPGEFYGPGGEHHVRVALTATDERIAAAAARLAG
ncbi:MAG TPA: succinyldiaminopimelate transaminase [Actinocrinis sp.]|nr:succinyldiaminopimelate transaminase [Actinocrinis sp.]